MRPRKWVISLIFLMGCKTERQIECPEPTKIECHPTICPDHQRELQLYQRYLTEKNERVDQLNIELDQCRDDAAGWRQKYIDSPTNACNPGWSPTE